MEKLEVLGGSPSAKGVHYSGICYTSLSMYIFIKVTKVLCWDLPLSISLNLLNSFFLNLKFLSNLGLG